MVGYDTLPKNLTHFDIIFAGGFSGCFTRATCQPLDVLKIRFQLQIEPISHKSLSKYRSLYQGFVLICREEGVKALWKGHVPAQWLSVVYGVSQFWAFETLTKKAYTLKSHNNYKALLDFACGGVAGCAATLTSFPFDVVRTRLVAQWEHKKAYSGVLHAFENICKEEGCLVLFRGLLPTFLQVAPYAGMQFMCYEFFEKIYKNVTHSSSTDFKFFGSLISGSLAGLCSKAAIYPFDLLKKRLQVQGFEHHRDVFGKVFSCRGLIDCIAKTYKFEGISGLFKGLNPSLIKAIVTSALHFSSYELTCHLLSIRHDS